MLSTVVSFVFMKLIWCFLWFPYALNGELHNQLYNPIRNTHVSTCLMTFLLVLVSRPFPNHLSGSLQHLLPNSISRLLI
ncbi:hypothetical protein L1887_29092 [Cichorium endivia]|nr:hypothetical protein L1887_29092 [Cichorium endivia]